jgi:hypothetical protein
MIGAPRPNAGDYLVKGSMISAKAKLHWDDFIKTSVTRMNLPFISVKKT